MPWFKLWTKDFMADPFVQGLAWDRRGRYLWALMSSWETRTPGVAPEEMWMRWLGYSSEQWEVARPEYAGLFVPAPPELMVALGVEDQEPFLMQRRLVREYQDAKREMDRRSGAGTAGAKARWSDATAMRPHSDRNAEAMASQKSEVRVIEKEEPKDSSPNGSDTVRDLQTGTAKRKKTPATNRDLDREWLETFDEIWWPDYLTLGRKCSRAGAREVWAKIPHPDGQTDFDRLWTHWESAKVAWRDERREPRFIPHAEVWLRDYLKNLALEA
jgi:uncharacterized protein YdaU (DUF1376 family)